MKNKNKIDKRPVLNFHYTNGVGNNLFQYMYGNLVCNGRNAQFSHSELSCLGIKDNVIEREKYHKKYIRYELFGDCYEELLDLKTKGFKKEFYVDIKTYPENYLLYTPYRDYFKKQFKSPKIKNTKDLILHLRAGDRLIMAGCYRNGNPITIEEYKNGLSKFKFDKLHIVTDMPVWQRLDTAELAKLRFHRKVNDKDRIDLDVAVTYWNSLYDFLSEFDPIVRWGKTVDEDFNYIRQFDQIMFAHGTLAWWAAFLSDASKVGLYGRWRGGKDINLGWTDLPGWFQWGRLTAPPRSLKELNLIDCAIQGGHRVFVETGTKGGATLFSLQDKFKKMYSVELATNYYERVFKKVKEYGLENKIKLYNGDSAQELKKIIPEITEPSLFWLDAHDGKKHTPILEELDIVLNSEFKHTIVIDDYRYFIEQEAYPSFEEVVNKVKSIQPDANINVKFDSIRIFM